MGDAVRLAPAPVQPAGPRRVEPPDGSGSDPVEGDRSGDDGVGVAVDTGLGTGAAVGPGTGVVLGVGAGDGTGDKPGDGPGALSELSAGGTVGCFNFGVGVAVLIGSVGPAAEAGIEGVPAPSVRGAVTPSEEQAAAAKAKRISGDAIRVRNLKNGNIIGDFREQPHD